jgi:uncharacterized membrane protein YidH (DUF202 family)
MAIEQQHAGAKAHVMLAQSTTTLVHYAEHQPDNSDRRAELATDRTVLTVERTYVAWARTVLATLAGSWAS